MLKTFKADHNKRKRRKKNTFRKSERFKRNFLCLCVCFAAATFFFLCYYRVARELENLFPKKGQDRADLTPFTGNGEMILTRLEVNE